MLKITLPENLKELFSPDMPVTITSDEVWAFTEQPKMDLQSTIPQWIDAHELFALFTANIIIEKVVFTR